MICSYCCCCCFSMCLPFDKFAFLLFFFIDFTQLPLQGLALLQLTFAVIIIIGLVAAVTQVVAMSTVQQPIQSSVAFISSSSMMPTIDTLNSLREPSSHFNWLLCAHLAHSSTNLNLSGGANEQKRTLTRTCIKVLFASTTKTSTAYNTIHSTKGRVG